MEINLQDVFLGHQSPIYTLYPDEKENFSFYAGAGDGWVSQWSIKEPNKGVIVAKAETQIFSLVVWNDTLVAGNMNGGMHWMSLSQNIAYKNILHHKKGVFDLRLQNEFIYSAGGDGIFTRWNKELATPLESIKLTDKSLRSAVYDSLSKIWAIGASDGNIYIVKDETLSYHAHITNAHDPSVFALAFCQDTQLLYSGGRDALLKVWKLDETPTLLNTVKAHLFTINDLKLSPDGQYLASASRDKTIKIWKADTLKLLKVLEIYKYKNSHTHSVNCLLWLDNNTLVSGGDDRKIGIWEVK